MEWVKRLIVNSSSIKAQNTWEVEIVLDICFFLNCVIISVILKYLKCLRHLLSKSALQMGQYLGASKELKSLHMPQPLNRYILKCLLFCSIWVKDAKLWIFELIPTTNNYLPLEDNSDTIANNNLITFDHILDRKQLYSSYNIYRLQLLWTLLNAFSLILPCIVKSSVDL